MNELHELKEKLMRELEEYAQNGKYSKEDVETIKYMASAVDHLCNITERENYSSRNSYDGGMSNDGGMNNGGGNSYRRSYARKRDSMGRYARYSRDGYSGHDPQELVEELRGMMDDLPQNVQQDANRLIQKLEQM